MNRQLLQINAAYVFDQLLDGDLIPFHSALAHCCRRGCGHVVCDGCRREELVWVRGKSALQKPVCVACAVTTDGVVVSSKVRFVCCLPHEEQESGRFFSKSFCLLQL